MFQIWQQNMQVGGQRQTNIFVLSKHFGCENVIIFLAIILVLKRTISSRWFF